MSTYRKLVWSLVAVATLVLFAFITPPVMARGGGHGGGHGGFHGGGHGGGHHSVHPYRPSQHHTTHHADHHNGEHHVAHRDEHHNHHHHSWHHGGWGPGYWGGAALGYGLGGWAYDGGNTYVNNTTDVADDDSNDDDASEDDTDSSDDQTAPTSTASASGFPTDDWPELGINTYAGQYGGTQGQVVVRVVPGSAAAKAGIVAGDVILALNGQPTPSADAMEAVFETANLKFTAEVWDARTGRKSTLSGPLDPNAPATAAPQQL